MSALSLEHAVDRIAAGGLIGFPTETSWGLAADAHSERAMAALCAFKGRGAGKPVAVLVDGADALVEAGAEIGDAARALIGSFWPGPLTLVLSCSASFARGIASSAGAVGFRCSPHPVAHALAALARSRGVGPVTATSLNASGAQGCSTRAEAEGLAATALALVSGSDAGGTAPSTVVDATGPRPRILRDGAIPRTELARILSGDLAA